MKIHNASKEKIDVVLFLDYANINRASRDRGYHMDYNHLLEYIGEARNLVDAHCYIPIDPRNEHRLDREIEDMWGFGYIVSTKIGTIAGEGYKCNFDIEITMDVLRIAYQSRPDVIVLATGDSDFVPLVQELRKSGIRVEVASFEESAARDLILKCSGFISLDAYYREMAILRDRNQDRDLRQGMVQEAQDGESQNENINSNPPQNRNIMDIPSPDNIEQ